MQVAPSEIEDTLLAEPHKLIYDATVAGVSGGRTADERVPRAWVVLSDAGRQRSGDETVRLLNAHVNKTLSKYKHLRGGIEVVSELPKSPTGKVRTRSWPLGNGRSLIGCLCQVLRRKLVEHYDAKQKVKAKL
jgi:acyl-coenzyme A synthetase/AMP-(fatty) acid ligase